MPWGISPRRCVVCFPVASILLPPACSTIARGWCEPRFNTFLTSVGSLVVLFVCLLCFCSMCDFRLFIFWRALRRHEFLREFYSYWQKRPSWHCRQWSDFFFVNIALRFRAKCHEIVYIWTGTLRLSWTLPVYPSASFLFFKISFMPLLSSSGKEELKKKKSILVCLAEYDERKTQTTCAKKLTHSRSPQHRSLARVWVVRHTEQWGESRLPRPPRTAEVEAHTCGL